MRTLLIPAAAHSDTCVRSLPSGLHLDCAWSTDALCRQLQRAAKDDSAAHSRAESDLQATIARLEGAADRLQAQQRVEVAKLQGQIELLDSGQRVELEKASRVEVALRESREREAALETRVQGAGEEVQVAKQVLHTFAHAGPGGDSTCPSHAFRATSASAHQAFEVRTGASTDTGAIDMH
jgi:hypothetical protein